MFGNPVSLSFGGAVRKRKLFLSKFIKLLDTKVTDSPGSDEFHNICILVLADEKGFVIRL